MLNAVNHGRPDDAMRRIFPQMIAVSKVDPMPPDAYQALRRRAPPTVADRADPRPGARRAVRPADLALVHDLLVAPLIYRWLISDGDVGAAVVQQISTSSWPAFGVITPS